MGGCRDEAELKIKIVSKVRDYLRASEPPLDGPYQVGLEETSKELIQTLNLDGKRCCNFEFVRHGWNWENDSCRENILEL